jgi:hypothetical protein
MHSSPRSSSLSEVHHVAALLALLTFGAATPDLRAAEPVGPITFSTNANYDTNFKESVFDRGNTRHAAGYLQLQGFQYGPAVFDTSANGGSNGSGGTGGNDANNDYANFTISADVATTEIGLFGVGFLLRLDSGEANGYFASVLSETETSVRFDLFEGASLNGGFGSNIFSTAAPLTGGVTLATNQFFAFKVTATDGKFDFDFGSGAAQANFNDTSVSSITGQVGFVLTTASPSAATRLDNFAIVPEPATSKL